MTREQKTRLGIGAGLLCLFLAAFSAGLGIGKVMENHQLRKSYQNSSVDWKQALAEGEEEQVIRDHRNQQLAEHMQYISINPEMISDGSGNLPAGISVDARSDFGCIVTLIRDATGEILYRSGVIDPGHYIEEIQLDISLKEGYYPCTAVWSFYSDTDEYVGEAAWKTVIVLKSSD